MFVEAEKWAEKYQMCMNFFFLKKNQRKLCNFWQKIILSLAYNVAKKTPGNCKLLKDMQKAG